MSTDPGPDSEPRTDPAGGDPSGGDAPIRIVVDDAMPTVAVDARVPPDASLFVDHDGDVRDGFTAGWVANALAEVVAARGSAVLGLVGGSSVGGVHAALADPAVARSAGLDWSAVTITVADERAVPMTAGARNWRVVEDLVDPLRDADLLAQDQLVPLGEVPVDASPDDVEAALGQVRDRVARIDVALLGLGPDGHVASLFPGHPALGSGGAFTVVTDSPKPPPLRMSATVGMLAGADAVALVGVGDAKADAVTAVMTEGPLSDCPGRVVHLAHRGIVVTDRMPPV